MMGLHAAILLLQGQPQVRLPRNSEQDGPLRTFFNSVPVHGGLWHVHMVDGYPLKIDATWGYHPGAETILFSMLAIQSYDTPTSMYVFRNCGRLPCITPCRVYLVHTIFTIPSVLLLRCVFPGVIELSSPFLAVVDAARDYPKIAEKYPITNEICRVMFAIVFYIVRIFGWFPVSYCFWRDALLPAVQ